MRCLVGCEWGAAGIEHLRDETDVFIVVDVLSFTTCVDIAVSRGAWVYPYRWNDFSSAEFANQIGGILAGSTHKPGFSLSPSALLEISAGVKLILPSPNGSTLSLMTGQTPTLAACLRNARSVAQAARRMGERISVIPGGERWKDGSLRVAIEDWLGAGAVIHHLGGHRSAEAELACRSFESSKDHLNGLLENSLSGRELIERNRIGDIHLAAQMDSSRSIPWLVDGSFQEAGK
jgi:2-phosphosulfolactate phosphatase